MELPGMNRYIGIEIGGTKQQIAVGTSKGELLYKDTVQLEYKNGASDILEWIRKKAKEILKNMEGIQGIGVGFGGPLETSSGRVLCSLQVPGWDDFKLKEWFEKELGIKTTVFNDTVVGGIAELHLGAGIGSKNLFYTNIGTGIGGGLYINGNYYDGIGYGASYLGNSLIPDWTRAEPGSVTRLELICSGKSIETRLNQKNYISEESSLYGKAGIKAFDLARAAREGDLFAKAEIERVACSFSIGLANVLALEAPDRIVIGGGVAKMGDILFDAIRYYTERFAFVANKGTYKIVPAKLMDDAVLVGALLIAADCRLN